MECIAQRLRRWRYTPFFTYTLGYGSPQTMTGLEQHQLRRSTIRCNLHNQQYTPKRHTHAFFFFQQNFHYINMQNENGENVDLYVPRKCSWTNRILTAKDHGSVQINVANVDPVTGVATGEATAFALSGYVRFNSEGDMALGELVIKNDAKLGAAAE